MDSIVKVLQYFRDQKKYQDVIDGYYGTLIENFECDKTFFTAVEVTAGNRWDVITVKSVLLVCPLCDKTFFTAVEVTAGNRWDVITVKSVLFSLSSLW